MQVNEALVSRRIEDVGCRHVAARAPRSADPSAVSFIPAMRVKACDGYELRLYEPFVALAIDYEQRQTAYDHVAAYQKGVNSSEATFTETQPILLCYSPDRSKQMQALVGPLRSGEQLQRDELPQPILPRCRLIAAGGYLCAAMSFAGGITPATVRDAREQLLERLARDGARLQADEESGYFCVAQYGPVRRVAWGAHGVCQAAMAVRRASSDQCSECKGGAAASQVYSLAPRYNELLLRLRA